MSPKSVTFFVDRSLGREKVAAALRAAGARVVVHDDHFAPDAADETWLAEAGRQGWIVLTKDRMIRYHPHELAALEAAGVHAFVLAAGNITGAEMALAFTNALGAILQLVASHEPPLVARVSRAGAVSIVRIGR